MINFFTEMHLKRWLLNAAIFLTLFLAIQAWQQRDIPSSTIAQTGGWLADGTAFCLKHWFEEHPDQKVVALHFWADWCPICKLERDSVTSVAEDWPVITVAMQSGKADTINAYMKKEGLSWTTLVDDTGRIASDYGLKGVPAFIVIGRNGMIRSVSTGYTTELGMIIRLWLSNLY